MDFPPIMDTDDDNFSLAAASTITKKRPREEEEEKEAASPHREPEELMADLDTADGRGSAAHRTATGTGSLVQDAAQEVESYTELELLNIATETLEKLTIPTITQFDEAANVLYKILGIDVLPGTTPTTDLLSRQFSVLQAKLRVIERRIANTISTLRKTTRGPLNDRARALREVLGELANARKSLGFLHVHVHSRQGFQEFLLGNTAGDPTLTYGLWTFRDTLELDQETEEMRDHQLVIHILCDIAEGQGLRKKGPVVYEPITQDDGAPTHTMRPRCTLKEFVFAEMSEDKSPHLDNLFTRNSSTPKCVLALLEDKQTTRFPTFETQRRYMAFKNVVIDMWTLRAYDHTDPAISKVDNCLNFINKVLPPEVYNATDPDDLWGRTTALNAAMDTQGFDGVHCDKEREAFEAAVTANAEGEEPCTEATNLVKLYAAEAKLKRHLNKMLRDLRYERVTRDEVAVVIQKWDGLEAKIVVAEMDFADETGYVAGWEHGNDCPVCKKEYSEKAIACMSVKDRKSMLGDFIDPVTNLYDQTIEDRPWNHFPWRCHQNGKAGSMFRFFGGRAYYPMKKFEDAGRTILMRGLGGAGKTSLVHGIMTRGFRSDQVAVLSSNSERQYFTSSAADKYFWYIGELKKRLNIDIGTLLEMITGGMTPVFGKYEKARENYQWTAHSTLVGQDVPDAFYDAGSSLKRRFESFVFDTAPKFVDETLPERMEAEFPATWFRCLLEYQIWCIRMRIKNPKTGKPLGWNAVQSIYLTNTKNKLTGAMHGLVRFFQEGVNDGLIITGEAEYCTRAAFFKVFTKWFRENNPGKTPPAFDEDFYTHVFKDFRVELKPSTNPWPRTSTDVLERPVVMLFGVGICDRDMT